MSAHRKDTMKRMILLASLPLLVALGCGDGTTIEIPGTECRERCVDGRIYDLSSIDHEQPSEGANGESTRGVVETFETEGGIRCVSWARGYAGDLSCDFPSRESAE